MNLFQNLKTYFAPAIFGGLLLYLSWYPGGFSGLVFIALAAFIYPALRDDFGGVRLFFALFSGFFLFHLLAAYWMYSSTFVGSLLAHIFNATYMALVIWMWSGVHKRYRISGGYVFTLLSFWLAFELLHQYWALAWPWFSLGHVFAAQPHYVQWYAVTGTAGGTAWILVVNMLFAESLLNLRNKKLKSAYIRFGTALILLLIPLLVSHLMKPAKEKGLPQLNVMIVQPNIHPLKEKFGGMTAMQQLEKVLNLAESHYEAGCELMLFPETMLVSYLDEEALNEEPLIQRIHSFLEGKDKLKILTGAFTKRTSGFHPSDGKKQISDSLPYVLYNSALLIDADTIVIYHKNRLVPLVEKQPFLFLFRYFQSYIEKSGGFFGSYGTHNDQYRFRLSEGHSIRPIICFESAFSYYAASEPAEIMAIITNDGWWSTPGGYYQHLQLARLRAIENKSWVLRAANTGVSAVINPEGKVVQFIDYAETDVIKASVPFVAKQSFFGQYPWLGSLLLMLPGLLLLLFTALRQKP